MRLLGTLLTAVLAATPLSIAAAESCNQTTQTLRNVMYFDQYHTTTLPPKNVTAGITHVIMAFANSSLFIGNTIGDYKPFMPVEDVRAMFDNGTKVGIALGGWGDTAGFSAGAKTAATRAEYARNVAAMATKNNFDFVDIDWEYPAGNGQDYKQIPNSAKTSETTTFPLFLHSLKTALSPKPLSIAVPGRHEDMLAFTPSQSPKIWSAVDFVNVMTYDLMNRRSNSTLHHSSVKGSLTTIDTYISLGLPPSKINLGIAFYAKYFQTPANSTCTTYPIGCPITPAENPDGSDAGTSSAVTFEKSNVFPPPTPKNLTISTDGTCGISTLTTCAGLQNNECCSPSGYCGSSSAFCGVGCQSPFSNGCTGPNTATSFVKALKEGKTDEENGGQWYFDQEQNLFWTWDTAELISRKFKDVVAERKLGGVMAWSLGEDSAGWEHVGAMQEGVRAFGPASHAKKRHVRRSLSGHH